MQLDLKNCTIKIKDGTGTPNEISVKVAEGSISWTERRNMEYTRDRGTLDEVREGDEEPMDVSFDFLWEYIRGPGGSGATPTIEDALKNVNDASGWVSSDTDTCRPYAVDIEIHHTPDCGSQDEEKYVLPDFRYEELQHDLNAGMISCSGKCNATKATVTRGASL
jgi:hypothetical protein